MHRRAEDKSVRLTEFFGKFVHDAVEGAAAQLCARAAADAAADGLAADPEDLGFDPALFQCRGDLAQRAVGAAVLMRAAVHQKYFHCKNSFQHFFSV